MSIEETEAQVPEITRPIEVRGELKDEWQRHDGLWEVMLGGQVRVVKRRFVNAYFVTFDQMMKNMELHQFKQVCIKNDME